MSDTVEFATESGFECAYGGGGVLLLDGERREEKRDDREEGREGGGGRRRGPFVPRPSTSEDRSTNRRRRRWKWGRGAQKEEEEEEESGDSLGCDCPLARPLARWREMLEGSENACASAENDCDPDDRGGQERK